MRDLTKSDKNKLVISDARSGTEIELYYRTPSTKEEVDYQKGFIKKQGGKIVLNAFETRRDMGLKILTGFREGDFGVDGKAISNDPESPNYKENWKELLRESASDIISALAVAVFEGARVRGGVDLEETPVEGEATLPLAKS